MNQLLAAWNGEQAAEAERAILPCNGSHAWAAQMVHLRPFAGEHALLAAADTVWWDLPEADWQQAFESHPRIGERHAEAATEASLRWSAGEQSDLGHDGAVKVALGDGNRAYEERFGRIFLVCATGKSAAEMLALLEHRMRNDPHTELHEAAEQQRRITQLRLRKWLRLPPARCEDV